MKKFFFALVLVCILLGVAWCGAGWWFGSQAQKQYELILTQKDSYLRKLQPFVAVTGRSYDRGLFNSTAVTSFVLNPPGEDKKPLRFLVVNQIHHGPLVFAKLPHLERPAQPALAVISTSVKGEEEMAEAINKLFEKVPELKSTELTTILNIDGSGESWLDVPAFKKTFPDDKGKETTVDFSGLNTKSRFDISLNDTTSTLGPSSAEVRTPDLRFVMKNLKGSLSLHQGIKGINVGESSLSCETIEAKDTEKDEYVLIESVSLDSSSGASGDTINGSVLARLNKLTAEKQPFGPFAFELELRKLDAEAISSFQQQVGELQQQIAGKTPEEAFELLKPHYRKLLDGLLAKSPEMEIKQLKGTTPWGDFSAHCLVTVSGTGGSIIDNPLLALAALGASVDASISEKLLTKMMDTDFESDFRKEGGENPDQEAAAKTREILETLIAQNLIVREGDYIKTSASYKTGKLEINGKPLDIGKMLKPR